MEVVYSKRFNEYIFKENIITGFYGDILDLIKLNDIEGIVYDDEWTVKRFLNGLSPFINNRVTSMLNYLEINPKILKEKIKDLSKVSCKYVLLAYLLLQNQDNIVFDHFEVGMNYAEQKRFAKIVRTLKKDGKNIIVISTNLVFMSSVIEVIAVVKNGNVVYNGDLIELISGNDKLVEEPEIIKFIKLANKKGAELEMTFDSKELLKDIYRSVC